MNFRIVEQLIVSGKVCTTSKKWECVNREDTYKYLIEKVCNPVPVCRNCILSESPNGCNLRDKSWR